MISVVKWIMLMSVVDIFLKMVLNWMVVVFGSSDEEDGCDGLVVTNLSSGFFKSFVIN